MHPYNHKVGQKIQTDVNGITADRAFLSHIQILGAAAVAASDTAVHALITLTAEAQVITTEITNPAIPRALRIKGNQAGVAGNVVIEGTNYVGVNITETIIANGANAVEGNKAFKTITKITVPVLVGAGDKISIGFNDKLGLPYKLTHNTVLSAYLDNAKEGTAPTVATSTTAIESNTIDFNSALNGKVVDVYLLV